MNEVVGYVLAVAAVGAFGYFIYTRIQANKNRPRGSGRSGGGSGGGGSQDLR